MPSYPPVQSVKRALELLAALNEQKISSVEQLRKRTGLPKATIVRLLQTMTSAGFVTNDRRQGGYQVTSLVQSLSHGFHGDPMVIEAGRPWAIGLTRRHKWPVSIATLHWDHVVVRFSTIPDSAISPFHATINMKLSLVSRGLGRAYLAFCPAQERKILLDALEHSGWPEDAAAKDRVTLLRVLAGIRKRGFAERDPTVEPRNSNTLAVPIVSGERLLATLGLTYFTSAVRDRPTQALLVDELHTAARSIAESVRTLESGGHSDPDPPEPELQG